MPVMFTLEAGETIAGRRLVKPLSEGGMGEVWLANKIELDKLVVLKFILPQFAAQAHFRALFEQEAKMVAKLDHPNIVRVFDSGRITHARGDILWFEQEYVRGEDLARLRQRLPNGFPIPLAIFIISEALKGLLFAHEYCAPDGTPQPIIHRDIKPHNVLVAYEGSVHLVDFGIAKMRTADNTPTMSGIKGTLGFIAPEHVMGLPPDNRSDLFSMGLVFWEVLGGQRLFAADNDQAVLWKTAECIIPPLAQHGVTVPQEVELIVRRLLARDPNDRYQTARQALDDLRRAPGGRDAGSLELKAYLAPIAAASLPTPTPRFEGSSVGGTPVSGGTAVVGGTRRTLSGPPRGEVATAASRPGSRKALVIGGVAVVVLGGALAALVLRGDGGGQPTPVPTPVGAPVVRATPPDAPSMTSIADASAHAMAALVLIPDAPPLAPPDAAPEKTRTKIVKPKPRPAGDDNSEGLRLKLPGD